MGEWRGGLHICFCQLQISAGAQDVVNGAHAELGIGRRPTSLTFLQSADGQVTILPTALLPSKEDPSKYVRLRLVVWSGIKDQG